MYDYICEKCGEEAYSKCVLQRSIFPKNEIATIISSRWKRTKNEQGQIVLILDKYFTKDLTDDEAEFKFLTMLSKVDETTAKIACCNHKWIPLVECMFGCCKPKEVNNENNIKLS